jgi:tetratricopeptide (TPR) repeat protein
VPVVPTEKGTPFFDKMQKIAKDFKGAVNHQKPLVIPYHPLLAFADRLLVDEGDIFSTDAPYRQLAEIIQKISDDADIYLQQINKSLQRGDWQEVIPIAQQGLQKNPANFYLLGNLAMAYYLTGAPEKGITVTNELLHHYENSKESHQLELIAQALFNKGLAFGKLQRPEEAIAAYDYLRERFDDATALALQERVAKALFNKGFTLGQLQRTKEAIATYDDLLGRFGDATALALQEQVAKTLNNKGYILISDAKKHLHHLEQSQ